jgi:IclR family transcriptional regulator, KDG regulon repressor
MIQSVQRALKLLNLVAAEREPVGVREVSRRSGLTVPTTQNLLKTLAAEGFLHFGERERKYTVGLAALLVAEAVDPVTCTRSFAHPFVERLQAETGATVVLVTLWQGKMIVADWCEPEHGLAVRACGRVLEHPFQMTTGRALMAHHPELVPDDRSVHACLRQVRTAGVAITENIGNSGIFAVAAPVFDGGGQATLSLGCSTPLFQMDQAAKTRLANAVQAMAQEMGCVMRPSHQHAGEPQC